MCIIICLRDLYANNRPREEDQGNGDEMPGFEIGPISLSETCPMEMRCQGSK